MKGIYNSGVDPRDLSPLPHGDLYEALEDNDYLIALTKNVWDNMQYDPTVAPFNQIPFVVVQEAVNNALHQLEDDIWAALRRTENILKEKGIPAYPGHLANGEE